MIQTFKEIEFDIMFGHGISKSGDLLDLAVKKEIIEKLIRRKRKLKDLGIKRIGLFGSFLKGESKRGSDIDFLVEVKRNLSLLDIFSTTTTKKI